MEQEQSRQCADAREVIVSTTPQLGPPQQLQKLGAARRRQGLSVRCVAQRLGRTVVEVRAQEEEGADISISDLYRWQKALEVPIEELLHDPQDTLSPRVLTRARLRSAPTSAFFWNERPKSPRKTFPAHMA